MTNKQRKKLIRIIVAATLMIIFEFFQTTGAARFFLYMIPYLIVGYDLLIKAARGIKNLRPLDENFLMAVATIGAICLALYDDGNYTEAVAVMLFYQVGELFESYAVGKSRKNISELMDIRPDFANIETESGIEQVDPDEVEIGTEIIVKPGEKIPIDGVVTFGKS
ncbi:MAG: heavy metal translocating P-type ATPase, partial [Selenomonadaceae bacterium]|nr:heavy metal translocating P-type ATPase [Selenomonadaceae bacterium]